jgi:sulfur-carrier protein
MKVKILFFAQLKDIFGCVERSIELIKPTTVCELLSILSQERGGEAIKGMPMRFAVNEEFVEGSHQLQNQDAVVFLPPVSGG